MLAFAFGALRWSPDQVWAATPRELQAAARGRGLTGAGEAASRADLAALMHAFPDHAPLAEEEPSPWPT